VPAITEFFGCHRHGEAVSSWVEGMALAVDPRQARSAILPFALIFLIMSHILRLL
jgi:hypothetical protein